MFSLDPKSIIDLYCEGLSQTKENALAMLEQSVGENIAKQVERVLNEHKINTAMTLAAVGSILVGCSDENNTFDKMAGRILLRGSVNKVVDCVQKALHSDPIVEKALKEEGALHGITDPVLLVQQVAAIYATEASKRSRFHSYCDDCDDEDDWRFNAPGAEGVACTLDLANLGKQADVQVEVKVTSGDKYAVDAIRARLILESGTILENACTPEYKAKLAMEMKKGKCGNRWPLNIIDSDLSTGMCKEYILDESPIEYKANGKTASFTRKSLHEKLTDFLDKEISPLLMQTGDKYNYPNNATFNGQPCFIHPAYYTVNPNGAVVSVYSAGELANSPRFNIGSSVGVVSGSEDKAPETKPIEEIKPVNKDDRKFPIHKDACKEADGKYVCPRCGSTVKKNGLNYFSPKGLPEGCLKDNENNADLMDTIKWAESAVCGPCSDQMKKVREKVTSEWLKTNKVLVEANKEVEAMEAAWVEADDQLKSAEGKLAEMDEAVKTLGKNVPEVFAKAHEEARFNVQTAQGAVASMKLKLDEATKKRNALMNGTAKPVALPAPKTTTATKTQATVIKEAPKAMNRKQRRAAERKAQAELRRSTK